MASGTLEIDKAYAKAYAGMGKLMVALFPCLPGSGREAARLGFSVAVVPRANAPKKAIEGLTIHAVDRIEEAIEVVRGV